MKRVTLLATKIIGGMQYNPGQQVDVDNQMAKRLIKLGEAYEPKHQGMAVERALAGEQDPDYKPFKDTTKSDEKQSERQEDEAKGKSATKRGSKK